MGRQFETPGKSQVLWLKGVWQSAAEDGNSTITEAQGTAKGHRVTMISGWAFLPLPLQRANTLS